jgi:hypothetical protein
MDAETLVHAKGTKLAAGCCDPVFDVRRLGMVDTPWPHPLVDNSGGRR